jgi:hypothetical protein
VLAWVEAGEEAEQAAIRQQGGAGSACPHDEARRQDPLPVLAWVADSPPGAGPDPSSLASEASGALLRLPPGAEADFPTLRLAGLRAAERPFVGVAGVPAACSLLRARAPLDPPAVAAVLAMCGVRAIDIESLVPRGSAWEYAAPVRVDGAMDGHELFRLLDAIGHAELVRRRDCLLLVNREVARLREASSARGMPPAALGPPRALEALRVDPRPLGFRDRPEADQDLQLAALFDGLRRGGIAFGVADTSLCDETLASARTLILPVFEAIGRPLVHRLLAWVEAGGTLVLGPRLPRRDWAGAPLGLRLPLEEKEHLPRLRLRGLELEQVDILARGEPVLESSVGPIAVSVPLGSGRLVHFAFRLPWPRHAESDALAALVTDLLRPAGVQPCYAASDPRVETELFEGEPRRFLFLANPTQAACRVSLDLAAREAIREVRGRAHHVRAGEALDVPARSVLLREVVSL